MKTVTLEGEGVGGGDGVGVGFLFWFLTCFIIKDWVVGSACGIDIFNLGITVLKELIVLHVFIETGFCICSGYPDMSSSFLFPLSPHWLLLHSTCTYAYLHCTILCKAVFTFIFWVRRGWGEGEKQEKEIQPEPVHQRFAAVRLAVKGPVLKPHHLECKRQFHWTWAPREPRVGKRLGHPERSQLPGATASSPGDAWVCGRISGLTIQVFVCSAFL